MRSPSVRGCRGFNSRTLGRVRLCQGHHPEVQLRFNSRTLGRVRLNISAEVEHHSRVSIHAPWEGCDCDRSAYPSGGSCFNSRTLGRVRLKAGAILVEAKEVSIHAPWEGCDQRQIAAYQHEQRFNSRTLGRVRRVHRVGARFQRWCFNSRTLGRVRRYSALRSTTSCRSFNSRTLGRVRPQRDVVVPAVLGVSIHAPWEGCDSAFSLVTLNSLKFQFTHPGKGATHVQSFQLRGVKFQFTHPGKGATSRG